MLTDLILILGPPEPEDKRGRIPPLKVESIVNIVEGVTRIEVVDDTSFRLYRHELAVVDEADCFECKHHDPGAWKEALDKTMAEQRSLPAKMKPTFSKYEVVNP